MASLLRFDGRVVLVTGAGGGEHAKAGGRAPASFSRLDPAFVTGETRAAAAAILSVGG